MIIPIPIIIIGGGIILIYYYYKKYIDRKRYNIFLQNELEQSSHIFNEL